MKNNSNLYERILLVAKNNGIAGPTELAKYLGYNNPEKIYRLNRINEKTGEYNNPSFDIILDLTNKFEDMNVRWLISGEGEMLRKDNDAVAGSQRLSEEGSLRDQIIALTAANESLKEVVKVFADRIPKLPEGGKPLHDGA